MKNHIATFVLLLIAAVAFTLQFFSGEGLKLYCDIAAFALSTVAAIVEIVVSERSGKETSKQIKKLKDNQLSVLVEGSTLCFEQGENK